MTDEQWIEATKPYGNPDLAGLYRKQNRDAEDDRRRNAQRLSQMVADAWSNADKSEDALVSDFTPQEGGQISPESFRFKQTTSAMYEAGVSGVSHSFTVLSDMSIYTRIVVYKPIYRLPKINKAWQVVYSG